MHSNNKLKGINSVSLWVTIGQYKYSWLIGICNKSSDTDEMDQHCLFDDIKLASNQNIVIVGDFNFPIIDLDKLLGSNSHENLFLKLALDCFNITKCPYINKGEKYF